MFLQNKEKYKTYGKVSSMLFLITMTCMLLSIVFNLLSFGTWERPIAIIGVVFFIGGLIVEAIPDFLEKDVKKMILDIILIVLMAIAFVIIWH
ncbi:hypothetical protein BUZ69_12265 [Staphylococcus saprophyticus]|uniref:hypothetical protein n=1 Tax=Staphylococcus saprophyticus TaxID=29385 RepID=UPI000D1E56A2|nr:hypothetical protein [Staphylococcus saprophyticus]PTK44972.1 hypothetical protein BUZ69_12265 [Staphylococcus saprophyticus]